jgi:hypothetical protein
VVAACCFLSLVLWATRRVAGDPCFVQQPAGRLALEIGSQPVRVSGYELRSESGVLVPLSDTAPFQLLLSNTPHLISVVNLGTSTLLEETLVLDAAGPGGWDTNRPAQFDVVAQVRGVEPCLRPLSDPPSPPLATDPPSGSIVDLGAIVRGATSGGLLTDAIALRSDLTGAERLDSFFIAGTGVGASPFDVPDFQAVDLPVQFGPSGTFDVSLDADNPFGLYWGYLGFRTTSGNALYQLRAGIVPDYDLDGQFTVTDVDLLSTALATGDDDQAFDLTDDQAVDDEDMALLLLAANRPRGDADFDGQVDFRDFVALANNFGLSERTWSQGDFDSDGRVAFQDFVILANNFNNSGASPARPVAVPEPSGLCLLLWGLAALGARSARVSRRGSLANPPGGILATTAQSAGRSRQPGGRSSC